MDDSGAPRRIGIAYFGSYWHQTPSKYEGLWAITGSVRTKRDGPGRSAKKAEKVDVEARVGIEPAYTALQAAA